MSITHDFRERLAFSEKAGHEAFWDAVYRKAFPNFVNHMPCPGDTESQRMGIDRLILLANGRVLRIDEKKRQKEYQDILLEYISVDRTGAPGWIEKDLSIDYLAYAFIQSKRCYLLPWPILRRAWIENGERWKSEYQLCPAGNSSYTTWSVAVPIKTLYQAVYNCSLIQL